MPGREAGRIHPGARRVRKGPQQRRRRAQERQRRESCLICQGQGFYQVAKNTVALCKHDGLKKTAEERGPELPEFGPIWDQVVQKLIEQIPRTTHQRLEGIKLLGIDGDTAIIGCTDELSKDWLEGRLYQSIGKALETVLGQKLQVEFVINQPP